MDNTSQTRYIANALKIKRYINIRGVNMSVGVGRKITISIGLLLIAASLCWIAYAVMFDSAFSMATFTGIVFGAILLLIGLVTPKNNQR